MFKLDNYGELVIDKIFFETYYPILFTCVNEMQDLFLCVCCQNNKNGKRWLLTRTDENNIIEMLRDKITIKEAFLKNLDVQITVFLNDEYIVTEHDEDTWGINSIYLPKEGEYIEADSEEFDEEIEYYQQRIKANREMRIRTYDKYFSMVKRLYDDNEELNEIVTDGLIRNRYMIDYDISSYLISASKENGELALLESGYKSRIEQIINSQSTRLMEYSNSIMVEKIYSNIDTNDNEDYLLAA